MSNTAEQIFAWRFLHRHAPRHSPWRFDYLTPADARTTSDEHTTTEFRGAFGTMAECLKDITAFPEPFASPKNLEQPAADLPLFRRHDVEHQSTNDPPRTANHTPSPHDNPALPS